MNRCPICIENRELSICNQCKVQCCRVCLDLHKPSCIQIKEHKYNVCKRHNKFVKSYCSQCVELTCDACLESHKDHLTVPFKIAYDSIQRDITTLTNDLSPKETNMRVAVEKYGQDCEQATKGIEEEEKLWTLAIEEAKHKLLVMSRDPEKLLKSLKDVKLRIKSLKSEGFPLTFVFKWCDVMHWLHEYENWQTVYQQTKDICIKSGYQSGSDVKQMFQNLILNYFGLREDKRSETVKVDEISEISEKLSAVSLDGEPKEKSREESHSTKEKQAANNAIEDDFVHVDVSGSQEKDNERYIKRLQEDNKGMEELNKKQQLEIERLENKEKSQNVRLEKCLEMSTGMVKWINIIKDGKGDCKEKMSLVDVDDPGELRIFKDNMQVVQKAIVDMKNELLTTEEKLNKKIKSIAEWTDKQRVDSEQQRLVNQRVLQEKNVKISQQENEIKIMKSRLTELQVRMNNENTKLRQQDHGHKIEQQKQKEQIKKLNVHINNMITSCKEKEKELNSWKQSGEQLRLMLVETEKKVNALEKEKDDLQTRLSSVAGDKLARGNPAITDLSDPNRPMKISEKYGELYDNEWTDAIECTSKIKALFPDVENSEIEEIVIRHLYKMLTLCYKECVVLSRNQLQTIEETIVKELIVDEEEKAISTLPCYGEVCKFRRQYAEVFAKYLVKQKVLTSKMDVTDWQYTHKKAELVEELATTPFIEKCVHLCWYMVVQDPIMHLSEEPVLDSKFDKNNYKAFVKSGDKVKFGVWPALFLHEGGPLLYKGVVQAYS